jgi:hypothetical protein
VELNNARRFTETRSVEVNIFALFNGAEANNCLAYTITKQETGLRGATTGVCMGVCVTPQSLSRRIYPYDFVGQIFKIFDLGLKSNSFR